MTLNSFAIQIARPVNLLIPFVDSTLDISIRLLPFLRSKITVFPYCIPDLAGTDTTTSYNLVGGNTNGKSHIAG